MDKKFKDKIGNLKRMILTAKMSQTPLELNYNGRISTAKVCALKPLKVAAKSLSHRLVIQTPERKPDPNLETDVSISTHIFVNKEKICQCSVIEIFEYDRPGTSNRRSFRPVFNTVYNYSVLRWSFGCQSAI